MRSVSRGGRDPFSGRNRSGPGLPGVVYDSV